MELQIHSPVAWTGVILTLFGDRNVGILLSLPDNSPEDEGLCPSMYSFHSSVEEKNKLLFTLTQYGIEMTVDRRAKKTRIQDWIQASVIAEVPEDEEEEEDMEEEDRQKEREAMEGKRQNREKTDKETAASTSRSSSH
jgi:serine/threonine-protein kinase SBK